VILNNKRRLAEIEDEYKKYTPTVEEAAEAVKEAAKINDESIESFEDVMKTLSDARKAIELLHGARKVGYETTEDLIKQYENLLNTMDAYKNNVELTQDQEQQMYFFRLEIQGRLISLYDQLEGKEEEVINTHKRLLDEFYKELDTTERTEENMTALIGKYVELGLTYDEVSEALENMKKKTEEAGEKAFDLSKAIQDRMTQGMKDFGQAVYDAPFDILQSNLQLTAEEGASFGEKLKVSFMNAASQLAVLVLKLLTLKALLSAFPELKELFRVLGGSVLGGSAHGGEIGKTSMTPTRILKYGRGGPLPGLPKKGDVNLGLFKTGEYLIPPERVNAETRPILEHLFPIRQRGRDQRRRSGRRRARHSNCECHNGRHVDERGRQKQESHFELRPQRHFEKRNDEKNH